MSNHPLRQPVFLTDENGDSQTANNDLIGSLTETAPGTDTASSGLNGRLQRIAQRLTSLMAATLAVAPVAAVSATGTVTSVNDTNIDTTILAANSSRKGATIYNESTAILYLCLSNTTSSATVYTVQLAPGAFYELPSMKDGTVYTGVIKGIWASDASGAARITEFT